MLPREKGTWVKPKLAKHRTAKSRLSINQFPESHETGIKKKNNKTTNQTKPKPNTLPHEALIIVWDSLDFFSVLSYSGFSSSQGRELFVCLVLDFQFLADYLILK